MASSIDQKANYLHHLQEGGYYELSRYFVDKVRSKREQGKVAVVLEEDYLHQLFFVDCDESGYPLRMHITALQLAFAPSSRYHAQMVDIEDTSTMIECKRLEISIGRPLISYPTSEPFYISGRFPEDYFVVAWSGKLMSERYIPTEQLNVKELMQVAQHVIKTRDGLIVDEAIANRLIK